MSSKNRPKCFYINNSYEVKDIVLGRGSFSTVFLARHLTFGNKVALKVINKYSIEEEYVLQNLHREAEILKKLNHPNIVNFYEELSQRELYCLSMEYIRGQDLSQYLKKQKCFRVSEVIAKTLFYQMISAVEHMHRNDILHRDLKQENILLENEKVIKIVDFGLSNIYQPKVLLRTHCGSMVYAAPELFQNHSVYGAAVDLWSLGVILYAMVIGRMPFELPKNSKNNSASIQRKEMFFKRISEGLKQKNWDFMRILSKDCCNLLKNLLQPDQFKRMQIKNVASHPWFKKDSGLLERLPENTRHLKEKFTPEIINAMAAKFGVSRHRVRNNIRSYPFNNISAIFFMLRDTLIKEVLYPPKDLESSFMNKFEKWKKLLHSGESENKKSSSLNIDFVYRSVESASLVESKSPSLNSSCRCGTVSTKNDPIKKSSVSEKTDNSKPFETLINSAKKTTSCVSPSIEQKSKAVKSYKNSRPRKIIQSVMPSTIVKKGDNYTKYNDFPDSAILVSTTDEKFEILSKESDARITSFERENVPESVDLFTNETNRYHPQKKYSMKLESFVSKPLNLDNGLRSKKSFGTTSFSVSENSQSCRYNPPFTPKTIVENGTKNTISNNDFYKNSVVDLSTGEKFFSVNKKSPVYDTKSLRNKNECEFESIEPISTELNKNQPQKKYSLKFGSFAAKPDSFDARHPKLLVNKSLDTNSFVCNEGRYQNCKFNPSKTSAVARPSITNYYSLNPNRKIIRPPSNQPSYDSHGNRIPRGFSIQATKPDEAYFNRNILISRADRGYGRTFFNSNFSTKNFRSMKQFQS